MTCYVSNTLVLEDVPGAVLGALDHIYDYPNPAWGFWLQKKNLAESRGTDFNEKEPGKAIVLHQREEGRYPLTALNYLKRECPDIKFVNQLSRPEVDYPPLNDKFVLRSNQEKFLEDCKKSSMGLIRMPTGAGKTLSMLLKILELKTTALILVPTSNILEQTKTNIRKQIDYECGVITDGKEEVKHITIATYQSFLRGDRGLRDAFGVVMFDEVHKAAGEKWSRILQMFSARYRYGFSATYDRGDGGFNLLQKVLGPLLHTTTNEDMYEKDIILRARVKFVRTPYTARHQHASESYKMDWEIARNKDRNVFVSNAVRKVCRGKHCLVLTKRTDQAERLAKLLADLNPVLYHSQMGDTPAQTKKLKQATIDHVLENDESIMIATIGSVGVGFDLPRLETLVLASPFTSRILTEQVAGRVMRSTEGKKECEIIDFVDTGSLQLLEFYEKRKETYKKLGFFDNQPEEEGELKQCPPHP